MKKISVVLLSLVLVFTAFTGVFAAEYDPPEDIYAADFAGVIESSVEDYIVTTGQELYELTGAQVVVVTIDFANGDMEDTAYEIFNDWGIGDPTLNNGILILMSIGDQDAWVLQGAGLERDLPASTISDMMDYYLADYFFNGEYSEGAKSIFDAFVDWLCDYYNVSLGEEQSSGTSTNTPVYYPSSNGGNYEEDDGKSLLGLIILIIIIILIVRRSRRKRRYYSGGSSYGRTYRPSRYTSGPRNYNNNRPSGGYGGGNSGSTSYRPSKPSSFGGGRSRGGGGGFSSGRSSSSSRSSFSSSRSSSSRSSFGGGKSRGGGGGFGKR